MHIYLLLIFNFLKLAFDKIINMCVCFCRDGWCEMKGVKRKKERGGGCNRIAFRTKSELEILDDGFKWRKYGKKSVKNSPNPR